MCLNDVITSGAEPLFFLDYLATSKVDVQLHTKVLRGIKKACNSVKIPLIGGETAEMPGMYKNKDYDLAGFCVGIVDKHNLIDKKLIKNGDLIIGIPSSGFHSNGYSLINKMIETNIISLKKKYDGIDLRKALIKPTKLYADLFYNLQKKISIHGAAHITGGGITDNVPRILPDKFMAKINLSSWSFPKIFKLIQTKAALADQDMLKTFNCGIGMVLIIDKKDLKKLLLVTTKLKYKPKVIGSIVKRNNSKPMLYEKN
jgi:phosphoribosylformylglycinamidine cyclo-ligase